MKRENSFRFFSDRKTVLILFFIWISFPSHLCRGEITFAGDYPDRNTKKPVSFGLIADIQYGDLDSLNGRHFRESLILLEQCVADLNSRKLSFTIQLGDIINGHNGDLILTRNELDSIAVNINRLNMPLYHVVGNHDLNAGKEYFQAVMMMKQSYYDFTLPLASGWHFVVLDGNDGGYGIISEAQMNWFRAVLDKVKERGEKAICFCHYALLRSAASHHLMAKPDPILEILDQTACVAAWIAGHDHKGGYALRNEVQHLTIKGMVEAPPENSYAIVKLYPDKIRIIGIGNEVSRKLSFRNEGYKKKRFQLY